MTDNLSLEHRTKAMKAVKSKGTRLENALLKKLWSKGVRYRRNVTKLFGNPDLAIKKNKVVVFIDSCFWHGCEIHLKIPESNSEYWTKKIMKNRHRDEIVTNYYIQNNWKIIRVWEHDLKDNNIDKIADKIAKEIKES